jgi:exodeoxyribonuclease V alpha subunit
VIWLAGWLHRHPGARLQLILRTRYAGIGARRDEIDDAIVDMKPQPEPSSQEVLAGLVGRVTYHNAENGFCVLRAKARGHRDVVTVVGHAAAIAAGEWITASGDWVSDRTHGQQFKARFLRTSRPTSADGIEKYLPSGMIRGVGPVYAKKLGCAFGEKVFDVFELPAFSPPGPSRRRCEKSWSSCTVTVSAQRAVRIFKTYGADAIQVMTENPYRLARDIRGIEFDRRRHRHEARHREDGNDPCARLSFLCVDGGHG